MKQLCIFILIIFCSKIIFAQSAIDINQQTKPAGKGNTYAVIVGISNYLDSSMNLHFADRDAIFFAAFLMSASGGSVPKKNIKLLLNADAQSQKVNDAIDWLLDNCEKDDNAFFYFSGHGAIENKSMFEDGSLICYNTSSTAFTNMGLSMDRLNKMANTISVTKNANVIIITDACHSGRMAKTKFNVNFLAGEQLMLAKEREIRMASCKSEELSIEKTDWGGGRGVFSYHLTNGLQGGLADTDYNGIVTLSELKAYLENAMANDKVLKNDGEKQTPVIVTYRKDDFQFSTVTASETIKARQIVTEDSVLNDMVTKSLQATEEPAEPEDYFFSLLKRENLESLTNDLKLDTLAADTIAFRLIHTFARRNISIMQSNKLKELESQLKNDPEKKARFNISLGGNFIDIGQEVILHYIKGDEAEMERRRYYYINSNGYDAYPKMFAIALKLSQADKYYSNRAAVFLHYFSGVALRLKIPASADPKQLIEQALREQKKALALEEHAAYIYNELGVLYQYKDEYSEAEKYYKKASALSPNWATPYSNLCGIYGLVKKYDKALQACATADSLQKNLPSVSISRGIVYERMGNQLDAEESYRNAIEINSRHYLPFERLGEIYLKTTDYALTDSFFYEAGLRKKGFHFQGRRVGREVYPRPPSGGSRAPDCEVDINFRPTDIFLLFTQALQFLNKQYPYFDTAEILLKRVIELDKRNPLAYHYLGKLYYDKGKWEPAELMFKEAILYSRDWEKFQSYFDSVKASVIYPYDHTCFEDYFLGKYYDPAENYYFAVAACESWKHFADAEMYLRKLIQNLPQEKAGYLKLYNFLAKQGRYTEAEQVLNSLAIADKDQSAYELQAFYKRMIDKFPQNGDWYYRLGLLLYNRAANTASRPYLDSIVWSPTLNEEVFIGIPQFNALEYYGDLVSTDRQNTGLEDPVILKPEILEEKVQYWLPGSSELLEFADSIFTPRKDGIEYLVKAIPWISERETLADINCKIGNIYVWAGSKKQACPYFEKSLALIPDNANARLTLVDIYKALYKNRAAFTQLNYLNDSNQINLDKRLLLARFNMYASKFDSANELLNKAQTHTPYTVLEINNLRGLSNMLANKPKLAIPFYETYLKQGSTESRRNTSYTLARLYAKTGNNNKAMQWLKTAIGYGFNYSFVLQKDPVMDKLRKTEKWKTLVGHITAKKYSQVL